MKSNIYITLLFPFFLSLFASCTSNEQMADMTFTLIPPSPVTDMITLDLRAGVVNSGDVENDLSVSFYLDSETKSNLLYNEDIVVSPGESSCVKFRWKTKGYVGKHKIILVAKSGKKRNEYEKDLTILHTGTKSTKRIDGAWMGISHWSDDEGIYWNTDIKKLSDNQWRELLADQNEIGMNIIVIQELFRNQMYAWQHDIEKEGYEGLCYYPSDLFLGRMDITAKDPLEAILAEADESGMHVFMGVGLYAWFDFSDGSLKWHKDVATELWRKYGHHDSFYGWYVSEEQDGGLGNEQDRTNIVKFFDEFQTHIQKMTPDKPVMLATNSHNVDKAVETYKKLLPNLDILCPFAFHRMPETGLTGEEAADLLQNLCDEAGTHFWMDMEVFEFTEQNALIPRPIKGLLNDLHRFPNFEKILCYQYPGLMNSPEMSLKPGGESTVKLYLDYKEYLESLENK